MAPPIAKGFAGLTSGSLLASIDVDESGVKGSDIGAAWTNTNFDGSVADPINHCANWTGAENLDMESVFSLPDALDQKWTKHDMVTCLGCLPLYCFQNTSRP